MGTGDRLKGYLTAAMTDRHVYLWRSGEGYRCELSKKSALRRERGSGETPAKACEAAIAAWDAS